MEPRVKRKHIVTRAWDNSARAKIDELIIRTLNRFWYKTEEKLHAIRRHSVVRID